MVGQRGIRLVAFLIMMLFVMMLLTAGLFAMVLGIMVSITGPIISVPPPVPALSVLPSIAVAVFAFPLGGMALLPMARRLMMASVRAVLFVIMAIRPVAAIIPAAVVIGPDISGCKEGRRHQT